MATYEITVKLPAGANSPDSMRTPRRVKVEAETPQEAVNIAQAQYGQEWVTPVATKVSD